ncbi:MAG: CBS domain-containing protein [Bacteroidetes bacterium]|nr:CBS domain-containing protein [Bacteroidota bacterium]
MSQAIKTTKIQELAYASKVEDAMSTNIVVVTPYDSILDVWLKLRDNRISGLPVVHEDYIVGIISVEDFIKCLMLGKTNELVKDHMTSKVETIYGDELLIHILKKFEKFKFGRFPVKDRDTNKLIGILTKGDVIECLLKKLEKDYYEEESQKRNICNFFDDVCSDSTNIQLKYNVIGKEFKKAGEKSSLLKNALLKLGISTEIIRRIVIASIESEMNMIIFTDGGELIVWIDENKIKVNAVDNGPGIPDIEKAMTPGYSTAPDWVREMGFGAGMGLPNIKNCTDEMKIDSVVGRGTNLEFIVNIKNETGRNN